MIYGKIDLENWRTARVEGEEPESFFESDSLRLFFYGTLYNRDNLQVVPPDETNAKLAADAFLSDPAYGFSRLDGSFTIVYYSGNECGVVRDHHGTHYSIYYTDDGVFASSWECLLEPVNIIRSRCSNFSMITFLQRGILKKGESIISSVHSLEGGQKFYKLAASGCMSPLRCESVFHYRQAVLAEEEPDVEAYSRRYGELHSRAIRRRIGDSSRVGILLSGGYDSGSNLAALRSIYDGEIDSYSVGFKGDAWTELPMARLMSDTFGTRHHEYEIDGTEIDALPDIVRFLEEPFVEGGLMVNYCAMRMIGNDKPDVILGGDGSDQYFGTSGREVALHYLAARTGMRPLLRGINRLLDCQTFDTGGKLSRIRFHLDKILHILDGDRFGFSDAALRALLVNPEVLLDLEKSPKVDTRSFGHLYTQHAIFADLETTINRVILFKASRMARMFGNNLVFPFMDLELFHFLQELPIGLKCKGNSVLDIARGHSVSKYLLKYHYKPLLPEAIALKKKQGGFAPMPLFFRDKARRARFKEFILSSGIMGNYLRRDAVEKFLSGYDLDAEQTGGWFWHKQNKALQYFNLLTLVVWWEEFVEKRKVEF